MELLEVVDMSIHTRDSKIKQYINTIYSCWYKLPDIVRQRVIKSGFTVYLVDIVIHKYNKFKYRKIIKHNNSNKSTKNIEIADIDNIMGSIDAHKIKEIAGMTDYDKREILITIPREDIEDTFIHEIGHCVDKLFSIENRAISRSEEFSTYFNRDKQEVYNNLDMYWLASFDIKEYFAELFTAWILDKQEIVYEYDDAINYIKRHII